MSTDDIVGLCYLSVWVGIGIGWINAYFYGYDKGVEAERERTKNPA